MTDGAGRSARRRLAAASILVMLAVAGCSSSHPSSPDSYGALPTFLPSSALHPDSLLVGTSDRPALTTEGDSVEVHVGSTSVRATVTGPEVPGEGLPYQAPATTCTWTVTLSGASAAVPIKAADFTSLDHLGVVYHPSFVAGQPVPPALLEPGRTVTFELRAVMVVGEGLMRWAPGGSPILASWDFEVEND